jgi:hypothetical protein
MKDQKLKLIDAPPGLTQQSALSAVAVSAAVDAGVTPVDEATNGQVYIGRTGLPMLLNEIDGTTNQVVVTNGSGTITLSLPQSIHTGASPTFAGLTLSGFTAKAFVYADASKALVSTAAPTNGQLLIGSTGAVPAVAALTGTSNQVVVTNGAGSITLSLPQSIGTGSSPTFAGLTLSGLTAKAMLYSDASKGVVSTAAPTDGQLLIGSTGNIPALGAITGTANQITVTLGAGTIGLNLPQNIGTGSSPTFAGVSATTFTGALVGNASTASALSPGATINGTTFTGAANITVTAAAGTLTGTTLNATVVTSSLTSVGTLTSLTVSGTVTLTAAASKIVPGATSFSIRNNADLADNLLITNAGAVTIRAGLTVTTGGATVSAGGAVIAGQITGTYAGTSLYVSGTAANTYATRIHANTTTDQSYGLILLAGTSVNDNAIVILDALGGGVLFQIKGNGATAFAGALTGITTLAATTVTAALVGNASTATALATPRAINGVNFDGTAAITVTAAAGTLTGTTLNATVVTSSLTSVGTLTSLTVSGTVTMTAAASKVVPGATSFAVRNNADSADNFIVTDAGAVTFRSTVGGITTLTATTLAGTLSTAAQANVTSLGTLTSLTTSGTVTMTAAASKIVPGATSFSHRNNADSADNLLISDAGAVTVRAGLTVTAGGMTINGSSIFNGVNNAYAADYVGGATTGQSFGLRVKAGTSSSDFAATIQSSGGAAALFYVRGDGACIVGSGPLAFTPAVAQIIGGSTSIAIRDSANTVDNVLVTDAGAMTIRASLNITGSLQCDSIVNDTGLAHGTYTPTLGATSNTNVAASTAYVCQYLRVGNVVTVSGRLDVDPTTVTTSTVLSITLPVASDLAGSSSQDCAGTAVAPNAASECAAIIGDPTNNVALMQWICTNVTNHAMFFQFTYRVL